MEVAAPTSATPTTSPFAKGPTGARKFASESYATGATYRRKLTRPGVYRIYCTFHETEMTMTITVRHKPR